MLGSAYYVGKKAKLFFHVVRAVETSVPVWYLIFQMLAKSWVEVRIILKGTLFLYNKLEEILTVSSPKLFWAQE